MAKISVKQGSINKTILVYIKDSTLTGTTQRGRTGLVFNTASLTCYYVRPGSVPVSVPLITQTTAGVHADGGFVELDSTNMKGIYRLDLPDLALATGAGEVVVVLDGAATMVECVVEIELTGWDNQDAVRGGLTALPNAIAAAANGLLINGTNAGGAVFTAGFEISAITNAGAIALMDDMLDETDGIQPGMSWRGAIAVTADAAITGEVTIVPSTSFVISKYNDVAPRASGDLDGTGQRSNIVVDFT